MDAVSYLDPAELHTSPAFTPAVRIPTGHDLVIIAGQNGVDSSSVAMVSGLAVPGAPCEIEALAAVPSAST
jgi:hypothetical protein